MPKKYSKRLRHIGQSTAEYAVLLAIVATALIGMQLYIKRGIQGRLRDLAIQLAPGPGQTPSGGAQYEGNKTSNYTTTQSGVVVELSDSVTATVYQGNDPWGLSTSETITRSGSESTTAETQ